MAQQGVDRRAYMAAYREKNREELRRVQNARREARREEGRCIDCGSETPVRKGNGQHWARCEYCYRNGRSRA